MTMASTFAVDDPEQYSPLFSIFVSDLLALGRPFFICHRQSWIEHNKSIIFRSETQKVLPIKRFILACVEGGEWQFGFRWKLISFITTELKEITQSKLCNFIRFDFITKQSTLSIIFWRRKASVGFFDWKCVPIVSILQNCEKKERQSKLLNRTQWRHDLLNCRSMSFVSHFICHHSRQFVIGGDIPVNWIESEWETKRWRCHIDIQLTEVENIGSLSNRPTGCIVIEVDQCKLLHNSVESIGLRDKSLSAKDISSSDRLNVNGPNGNRSKTWLFMVNLIQNTTHSGDNDVKNCQIMFRLSCQYQFTAIVIKLHIFFYVIVFQSNSWSTNWI